MNKLLLPVKVVELPCGKGRKSYGIVDAAGDMLFNTEWQERDLPDEIVKLLNRPVNH